MTTSSGTQAKAPVSMAENGSLGALVHQWRWGVILAGIVILASSLVMATGTLSALSLSRFAVPQAESGRAAEFLDQAFDTGAPNVTLLVTANHGDIDAASVIRDVAILAAELENNAAISQVWSYWRDGNDTLASLDRKHGLILLRLPGSATETRELLGTLSPELTRRTDAITVGVGGGDEVFRQVGAQAGQDFVRAELIIFPGAFVLLALIFRSFLTASLPIVVGLFAMAGTLASLRVIAMFTEVSTFALNLTLVLGLGLGIDYGLFIIARFREARGRGASIEAAVVESVARAGRTVVFSGITVAVSLAAMLVFPIPFLRSFAYAGVAVVCFGIVGAVFILPALLSVLGRWIRPVQDPAMDSIGHWHRLANAVMRRPGLYGGAALTLVLFLSSPIVGLQFGLPDDRILPQGASSRQVQEVIRSDFVAEQMDALLIALPGAVASAGRDAAIAEYAARLSALEAIAEVETFVGTFIEGQRRAETPVSSDLFASEDSVWLRATPTSVALETEGLALAALVRGVPPPHDALIGGYPADLADFRAMVLSYLPAVLAIVFGLTMIILFLMTGSVVLPLKATILNLLSLSVMFGGLVFVFQDGHFSGLLGFTPTGSLETSIPILMFCIAYGLSMDYEVFMLARIKEEYDRTGDNRQAVADGLARSGPLITAAAAILALAFLTYLGSGVVFLKMLGLGTALAIIVDATLIRAILVPAFMRLAGQANWWAPAPLKRLHQRFGIRE